MPCRCLEEENLYFNNCSFAMFLFFILVIVYIWLYIISGSSSALILIIGIILLIISITSYPIYLLIEYGYFLRPSPVKNPKLEEI